MAPHPDQLHTPTAVANPPAQPLTNGDWDTDLGGPITEETVTAATRPLTDTGWKHTVDGRFIRWETAQGDAGVQFDAFAAPEGEKHV
ncbi:hypothetical protein [Streptomyces olivaceus]|uniref:hypothetical protein n=1 Tax=Streptomyces olivaceus TaxID=47716 RepID=UPI0037B92B1C